MKAFLTDCLIDNGWDPGWVLAALIFEALAMLYVAFGDIVVHYIWMVFVGMIYPTLLFGAFLALEAICEGSFLVRIFALVFMAVYFGIAYLVLIQGRVFV